MKKFTETAGLILFAIGSLIFLAIYVLYHVIGTAISDLLRLVGLKNASTAIDRKLLSNAIR